MDTHRNTMGCSEALEQQMDLAKYLASKRLPENLRLRYQANTEFRFDDGATRYSAAGLMGEAALGGDTYYWAPEVCQVIQQTAQSIPDWTLTEDVLPGPHGFCWFAEPLVVKARGNKGVPIELPACTWTTYTAITTPCKTAAGDGIEPVVERYVTIVFYARSPYRRAGEPLILTHWLVGRSYLESVQDITEGIPTSISELVSPEVDTMKIFAAMMTFLTQRIMVTTSQAPDRATRRRIAVNVKNPNATKALMQAEIRVVGLRRKTYQGQDKSTSEHPVEWTARWVVRGHWRQQWYPSLERYQPKWIQPYIKGPEDKPLKTPKPTLFAVRR